MTIVFFIYKLNIPNKHCDKPNIVNEKTNSQKNNQLLFEDIRQQKKMTFTDLLEGRKEIANISEIQ